jgi:hypothetical protein
MFDPKFKDLSIASNYVLRGKIAIAPTIYDSITLIPLLTLVYQKVHYVANPTRSSIAQ